MPDIIKNTSILLITLFVVRKATVLLGRLMLFFDEANNYSWPGWPFDINILVGVTAFLGFYLMTFILPLYVLVRYKKFPIFPVVVSTILISTSVGFFLATDWVALFRDLISIIEELST